MASASLSIWSAVWFSSQAAIQSVEGRPFRGEKSRSAARIVIGAAEANWPSVAPARGWRRPLASPARQPHSFLVNTGNQKA